MRREECNGSKVVKSIAKNAGQQHARHNGHQLMQTGPWAWCFKCGKHSVRRVVGLARNCSGQLGSAQYRRFHKRLWAGHHPYNDTFVAAAKPLVSAD